MAQFFNRQEAENFSSNIMEHFPQLRVENVHDISSKETGEYLYSYFSIWFGKEHLFHTYVSCQADWNIFLSVCEYVVQAIADNQQNEKEDNKSLVIEVGGNYWCQICKTFVPPDHYPQDHSFTDQNGLTVQQGGVYGIDEQGDLYDIEPLNRFRPSEY